MRGVQRYVYESHCNGKLTNFDCAYKFCAPSFFLAGPSLNVLKSRAKNSCADDDVFTTRAVLSPEVATPARSAGRRRVVK